ncbi:hypothetical protein ACQPW3_11135 [Actinosynnema sp. CA-248983]
MTVRLGESLACSVAVVALERLRGRWCRLDEVALMSGLDMEAATRACGELVEVSRVESREVTRTGPSGLERRLDLRVPALPGVPVVDVASNMSDGQLRAIRAAHGRLAGRGVEEWTSVSAFGSVVRALFTLPEDRVVSAASAAMRARASVSHTRNLCKHLVAAGYAVGQPVRLGSGLTADDRFRLTEVGRRLYAGPELS